jgi:hypothetical protein
VQRQKLGELVLVFALVLLTATAAGQSSFELGTVLGGIAPTSTPPWLTATFTDTAPGHVTLTLQSHLDVSSEFIGEVCLNLNPAYNPVSLTFLQLSGPLLEGPPSLSEDGIKLTGAGALGNGFDILLSWPTAHGQDRFDGNDAASFDISGVANLTLSDFDYYNTVGGEDGEGILGAHMQGIPVGGTTTGSGAIIQYVPEPASWALLAVGLTAVALRRARRGAVSQH